MSRLVADAPAFGLAAGSSAGVNTLVDDVRTVVDGGAGSTLNPFRVTVSPSP